MNCLCLRSAVGSRRERLEGPQNLSSDGQSRRASRETNMRFHRSRIIALTAVGTTLVGFVSCTHEVTKSETPAPSPSVAAADDMVAANAYFAAAPLGRVITRSAAGAARLVVGAHDASAVAPSFSRETAARVHLSRHASLLGLTQAAVQDAVITASHELPEGASIVQFKQRVNGIDVFQARASVVLDGAKNLSAIASGLVPSAVRPMGAKTMAFPMAAESAVARAYAAGGGPELGAGSIVDRGAFGDEFRAYAVHTPDNAMRLLEASAKLVLFPQDGRLVPAFHVEVLGRPPGSNENQARGYVIAADDGRVLYDVSLTEN